MKKKKKGEGNHCELKLGIAKSRGEFWAFGNNGFWLAWTGMTWCVNIHSVLHWEKKIVTSVTTLSWPRVWGEGVFLSLEMREIFYYSQKHPINALNWSLILPVYFVSSHVKEGRWLPGGFPVDQPVSWCWSAPKSSEVRLTYTSGQSGSVSSFHRRLRHLLPIWSAS